jgi:hypothetical protein
VTGFLALIASALVAWLAHVLIGDHVSMTTDFMIGTLAGGVAYVASFYWLRKLRSGL